MNPGEHLTCRSAGGLGLAMWAATGARGLYRITPMPSARHRAAARVRFMILSLKVRQAFSPSGTSTPQVMVICVFCTSWLSIKTPPQEFEVVSLSVPYHRCSGQPHCAAGENHAYTAMR